MFFSVALLCVVVEQQWGNLINKLSLNSAPGLTFENTVLREFHEAERKMDQLEKLVSDELEVRPFFLSSSSSSSSSLSHSSCDFVSFCSVLTKSSKPSE